MVKLNIKKIDQDDDDWVFLVRKWQQNNIIF